MPLISIKYLQSLSNDKERYKYAMSRIPISSDDGIEVLKCFDNTLEKKKLALHLMFDYTWGSTQDLGCKILETFPIEERFSLLLMYTNKQHRIEKDFHKWLSVLKSYECSRYILEKMRAEKRYGGGSIMEILDKSGYDIRNDYVGFETTILPGVMILKIEDLDLHGKELEYALKQYKNGRIEYYPDFGEIQNQKFYAKLWKTFPEEEVDSIHKNIKMKTIQKYNELRMSQFTDELIDHNMSVLIDNHDVVDDHDDEIDKDKCVCCFVNEREIVYDCGHLCVCHSCSDKIVSTNVSCPICRHEIMIAIKVLKC